LAGAAIAAPFAAHAGPITLTSNGAANTVDVDVLGNGDFEYRFSTDLTNHQITITPLIAGNVTSASYTGDNNFFCGGCIPEGNPYLTGAGAASFLNPFISSSAGILQKTSGTSGFAKGPWPNDGSFQFLGINFTDQGTNYIGWLQLSAQICDPADCSSNSTPASVTSQVSPFATVVINDLSAQAATPEPASIALLAVGAAGLAALRARRKRTS
jgi:hypothetical protein